MIKTSQGFIAISTVLILSAIFLSITLSQAMRAISGTDTSIALHERETARYLAHGCLDYARMELQRTLDYRGNESILIGEGACEIFAIAGEGSTNRVIMVEGTIGKHTVRIKDEIEVVSPKMIVTSSTRVVSF